ncbi:HAD family hydrolase [Streptomyces clavuligerus]|uniref:HAD-superfamily hydrolase n=1 Tax=Streptomyces clavuligerus TaxID=1901 RepID=B5GL97_STRCL|nr:HAD-IA family hydrolase [Streptomyces clavuligerus]ANW18112.1 haloacid dehalogenase [Streptomyces clavuligerus]AXU12673.1 HAD family hydrolase [Streptomyces clavuligerus]EDY47093.1 HAD-superfamily hydrolase [Streptomyces clavuligerus]EFG09298.1 HAD-superfamily hydrolase [Streptomyces clavuligerus]MBY6302576.1 HAD family hydrolase [Streptomyces clavuligerus]
MNALVKALRPARHVLLDFDGPVCSAFAGLPAPEVTKRLQDFLAKEAPNAPIGSAAETDPFVILRSVADAHPSLIPTADSYLSQLEEVAVRVASPTPGAESLLRACQQTGRNVWVVSNNAGIAIRSYLTAHSLHDYVAEVFGRVPGDPSSMKPSTRLLDDALQAADADPSECVFIGDAVRDVEAGTAAGVATIGYANKPHKSAKLAAAGAIAVTDSMAELAEAVTAAGPVGR